MRVVLKGVTPVSERFATGFLEFYTTHSTGARVARVEFSPDTVFPLHVDVPTEERYDCLMFNVYVPYTSNEGRVIHTHCGYACIPESNGRTDVLVSSEGSNTDKTVFGTVTLSFKHKGKCFITSEQCQTVGKAIIERSKTWYKRETKFQPIEKDLKGVHMPTYPCSFPNLPGCFFVVQHPQDAESEALFERALLVAMRRRCWTLEAMEVKEKACILMAESLGAIVNCSVYNEDCQIDADTGELIPDEMFIADGRTLMNGDCEDESREICNLAYSLRNGRFRSALVLGAQRALDYYLVVENLGTIPADDVETNKQYRTKGGRYMAHAFVFFMPKTMVAQMLSRGGGDAKLKSAPPGDAPAGMLIQDGIALFDADPVGHVHASATPTSGLLRAKTPDMRIKRFESVQFSFYHAVSSCFLLEDLVISKTELTPVRELAFLTATDNAKEPWKYGALFKDVFEESGRVAFIPTCILTGAENAVALEVARYFHPICAYQTDLVESDLDMSTFETTLGTQRVSNPPENEYTHNFFLNASELTDTNYLAGLRERVPKGKRLVYSLDFMSDTCYMAQVFVV
jgi:hypothetical protein